MPIDIPQAQINYFDEHHYLELEDYLTESQVITLHTVIETQIEATDFDSAYKTGRDLWRKDPTIKKITLSRDLAQMFSELTKTRLLQIGFDQVLLSSSTSNFKFTKVPTALKDISSIGPPVGGVLINLSKQPIETEDVIPHTPGSLLFFRSDLPLPFPTILSHPNQLFLLIAYCSLKPRYIACEADPHKNQLKAMDYAMGDYLTLDTHPLLIK